MKSEKLIRIESWINELSLSNLEIANYLENRKWWKAIYTMYMSANFGLLTPQEDITNKRIGALKLYHLSKDLNNKKGKGLAFELMTRHLMVDKDYEFAFRCFLQTKKFLIGDMLWIGLKELLYEFPRESFEEYETISSNYNDSPENLILSFTHKYHI
jgi:hypothetical protein